MTNVVVFSGGRGASTISAALAADEHVDLTVLVNGYDAGLSTGRVRKAFAGMLGPSDFRKTVGALTTIGGTQQDRALAALMEYRLPDDGQQAADQFACLAAGSFGALPTTLANLCEQLSETIRFNLCVQLDAFQRHVSVDGAAFDYRDLAIGNAMLGSLHAGHGFNEAVRAYQGLLGMWSQKVLNITAGEDLWLVARAGEHVCPEEGTLVAVPPAQPIDDVFLLSRASYQGLFQGEESWIRDSALAAGLGSAGVLPSINPDAEEALAKADVIVYGPGTAHSSLLPSYLTRGVGEAIAANDRAIKAFVTNLAQDKDQHSSETGADMLHKLLRTMSLGSGREFAASELLSHVLVAEGQDLPWSAPGVLECRGAWGDPVSGRHNGQLVAEMVVELERFSRRPVSAVAL